MKYAKMLVALTLAAAANSFAWISTPYGGKFSPDGSKIVYLLSGGPYGYDIYTVNAGGFGSRGVSDNYN
jgi:Tol biopolymer transport system component